MFGRSNSYDLIDMQDLSFFCVGAGMPNPQLESVPVHRYGYGLMEMMPFNTVFDPQTFHFITDAGGLVSNFFRDWVRGAMEYSSEGNVNNPAQYSPNLTNINPSTGESRSLPYRLNYKDDYATLVRISTFDTTGQIVDIVTLRDAYPINVSDLTWNWGDNDGYVITPITFAYTDIIYDSRTRAPNQGGRISIIPSYDLGALELEALAIEAIADVLTFFKY